MGSSRTRLAAPAKRRLGTALLAFTATGLLLTGCGGTSGSSAAAPGSVATEPSPASGAGSSTAYTSTSGGGAAGPAALDAAKNGALTAAGIRSAILPALQDRSVIRTASIEVRVKKVLDAENQIESLATGAGGYVGGEQTQADPDHPDLSRAVVTLRVPATALPQLLTDIGHLGGLLLQNQAATDVTGQVIDVQARLRSQQASVNRIRALLGQAKTLGQVIEIEGELANREGALESLQAQAKDLADQTSLATVTATLVGPEAAAPVKPVPAKGFGHGLSRGWDAFTSATTWLLTAIGAALPFLVLLVPLVWVALLLRRRRTTEDTETAVPPMGPQPAEAA